MVEKVIEYNFTIYSSNKVLSISFELSIDFIFFRI